MIMKMLAAILRWAQYQLFWLDLSIGSCFSLLHTHQINQVNFLVVSLQ